jgi:hypothetical protein
MDHTEISGHTGIEVNRNSVLAFINAIPGTEPLKIRILAKYGLDINERRDWFPQPAWEKALKECQFLIGDVNLFLIGQAIVHHSVFPEIRNLEEALLLLDHAYYMNHRTSHGSFLREYSLIGHYKLEKYDSIHRTATFVCNTPYPDRFDEGIIFEILNQFKPHQSLYAIVDRKFKDLDSRIYHIHW